MKIFVLTWDKKPLTCRCFSAGLFQIQCVINAFQLIFAIIKMILSHCIKNSEFVTPINALAPYHGAVINDIPLV